MARWIGTSEPPTGSRYEPSPAVREEREQLLAFVLLLDSVERPLPNPSPLVGDEVRRRSVPKASVVSRRSICQEKTGVPLCRIRCSRSGVSAFVDLLDPVGVDGAQKRDGRLRLPLDCRIVELAAPVSRDRKLKCAENVNNFLAVRDADRSDRPRHRARGVAVRPRHRDGLRGLFLSFVVAKTIPVHLVPDEETVIAVRPGVLKLLGLHRLDLVDTLKPRDDLRRSLGGCDVVLVFAVFRHRNPMRGRGRERRDKRKTGRLEKVERRRFNVVFLISRGTSRRRGRIETLRRRIPLEVLKPFPEVPRLLRRFDERRARDAIGLDHALRELEEFVLACCVEILDALGRLSHDFRLKRAVCLGF
jgi:hypothetical protein